MKKALLILIPVITSQVLHAHPGLDSHTHDSLVGEWGWLLIPIGILLAIGWYFIKGKFRISSVNLRR